MIIMATYAYTLALLWCLILLHTHVCDAFQSPSLMRTSTTSNNEHHTPNVNVLIPHRRSNHASRTKFYMMPETYDYMQQQLLLADGDVESWRQYVPLVLSVGIIIDILLGSPVANLALAPMKRASEKGAGAAEEGNEIDGGGGLFSAFGGGEDKALSRSRERVDSEAIAQAALDKAMNTLELKRFLEENKTEEQRYEDVRKKIDRQMEDLED